MGEEVNVNVCNELGEREDKDDKIKMRKAEKILDPKPLVVRQM
jgi:hypothetical protein